MTRIQNVALTLAAGLMLVAAPASVDAQWSLEGRVGSAVPSGELTEAPGLRQTAGVAFAADATYVLNNTVSAYGGLARSSFNCSGCSTSVSSTGFDGGVKLDLANSGAATPWVRGGLMLHRASVDGDARDWGLGVDSAVGIDWRLRPTLAVVPAVRLNSYNSGSVSLTYVTIDAGLRMVL